jgi:hypothetical protein
VTTRGLTCRFYDTSYASSTAIRKPCTAAACGDDPPMPVPLVAHPRRTGQRVARGVALNPWYPFGRTRDAIDGEVRADHRGEGFP